MYSYGRRTCDNPTCGAEYEPQRHPRYRQVGYCRTACRVAVHRRVKRLLQLRAQLQEIEALIPPALR